MDQKDNRIKTLEKDIARLKIAMNAFERQAKQAHVRQVRSDERARRMQQEVDHIKNLLKKGS